MISSARVAAGLVFLLLLSSLAWAETAMQRPQPDRIEITGGAGKSAWKLTYGSLASAEAHFAPGEIGRAWFSHGFWLRSIDTEKGTVIGRWRMPGSVLKLVPQGGRVEVEFDLGKEDEREFHEKLTFDPAAPKVPEWPMGWLLPMRVSRNEAMGAGSKPLPDIFNPKSAIKPEAAREEIPAFEEAVRRDPFDPWLRVALARLLRVSKDARADTVLRQAVELPSADYLELLPIAAFLDGIKEQGAARMAFDRGYRDFLERGYDPRLLFVLIGRLILYTPVEPSREQRPELMERLYRIGPGAEGAPMAWQAYADELAKEGKTEDAQRWRSRAGRHEELLAPFDALSGFGIAADRALLAIMALILAAPLYLVVLYRRYLPQRRLDRASQRPSGIVGSRFGFTNLQYWSRRERIAFLVIVLGGWIASGLTSVYAQGILRSAAIPIGLGMGSFAGPVNIRHLETKLPATAERDLLLAMAYQHSGDTGKAEQTYRRIPQFAESWNNLGVILKNAGKNQEAQQAFEQALKINPRLAESALNLGRPPSDEWTRWHQEFLPGRPMLATPKRQQMNQAFLGSTRNQVWLRALAGPFAGPSVGDLISLTSSTGLMETTGMVSGLFLALLVLALVLLFVIPRREVSQPAGPRHWVWEVLIPGTSPRWGVLGGAVLLGWCYLLVQGLLAWRFGSPYLMTFIALPNLSRAYLVEMTGDATMGLVNPGWELLYLAPALLFLLNLVVVWRSRSATT
ncbi:MAG: tetratricopeptide repeat protein [Terriglobales bacterium]